MVILSIDTSCDETSAAMTEGRRVLSNVIYSQILLHKKWGGVVPSIAKRAHEERIDFVVEEVLRKFNLSLMCPARSFPPISAQSNSFDNVGSVKDNTKGKKLINSDLQPSLRANGSPSTSATHQDIYSKIDFIAVTIGPGLAVALEVGIKKAKELAKKYNKKIIPVNHMEGHIYSCFVQNRAGNPERDFYFPYLALLVSGGHTELVIFNDHISYEVIGSTIDDAAGEALDKAAKILGLGYPGGAVIERLAVQVNNRDYYKFPRPMIKSENLNFSFSGLKTSFYYFIRKLSEEETNAKIKELASSFQEAVFDTLLIKTEQAIKKTGINRLIVGGGVIANQYLRKRLRQLMRRHHGEAIFPPFRYLTGDNAAMIGVVAHFKAKKGIFVRDIDKIDRIPRLKL